ncbi:MAG: hypothetical protein ACRC4N_00530, partial [Gammaproteobacteria bacterium]
MITLAILAGVHRKLCRKFEPKPQRKKTEEQTIQIWDLSEGQEALSMSYAFQNSNYRDHPPWNKDATLSDCRPDTIENHFICQNCRKSFSHGANCRGIQPELEEQWSTYFGSDHLKHADVCLPVIRDEAKRSNCGLRHDPSTTRMHQIALRKHISIAQRQTFSTEEQPNTKMPFSKHQHGEYGGPQIHQHHHTYVDQIQDNRSEGTCPKSFNIIVNRDIINHNQSNVDHQGVNQAGVQKCVTFNLAMERAMFVSRKEGPYQISQTTISKTPEQKNEPSPYRLSGKRNKSSTYTRQSEIHTTRCQGGSTLRVKLNLNPLRRTQVHPKSTSNPKFKDIKIISKKVKKDKSQKRVGNIDSEGKENVKISKKIPAKSQCHESSTNPDEITEKNNTEESCFSIQTSNLSAESIKPLGSENSSDPC